MKVCLRRIVASVLPAVFFLIFVPGCARDQQLTAIQIQPLGATFGAIDPTLLVNFKAFGTYIHPPQTKEITSLVVWHSNTPQVAQVSSSGSVSPNTNCGTAGIFATMHDNGSGSDIVSNSASVIVNGPASLGCTPSGAQAVLTVNITGAGTGNVTSVPTGITCPTVCSAGFTVGTPIVLTEAPQSSSTFGGWSGCGSFTATTCTVFLNANLTVSATFN